MERARKLIYMLAIFMMANMAKLSAQEKIKGDIPLHIEVGMNINTPHKMVIPIGTVIDLNYAIKRFSIHAIANTDFFIPKEGLTYNYNKVINLGGGIGFELLPREEGFNNIFEIRAQVTSSVGSSDLKNIAYQIGLYWHPKTFGRKLTPLIGAGYNLKDFSRKELSTYHGMFLSFGLRF